MRQFGKYLILGGANTLITTALLLLLSYLIPRWIAFSIAFAFGIVFSVSLTGSWVFNKKASIADKTKFGFAYLAIYFLGLLVTNFLEANQAPPWASIIVIGVTAPLSFLAGKFIFNKRY